MSQREKPAVMTVTQWVDVGASDAINNAVWIELRQKLLEQAQSHGCDTVVEVERETSQGLDGVSVVLFKVSGFMVNYERESK